MSTAAVPSTEPFQLEASGFTNNDSARIVIRSTPKTQIHLGGGAVIQVSVPDMAQASSMFLALARTCSASRE